MIILANTETILTQYFQYLEQKGKAFNVVVGAVCAIAVGAIDALIPNIYNFGFLYLLAIAFTTWFAGKHAGIIMALGCTALWAVDRYNGDIVAYAWNMLSALSIFYIVSMLLTRMRKMWEIERNLSCKDSLTGAMNRRAFAALAEYEMQRAQRECSPLSIAYIDIDDFKKVNDRYGHAKGDVLLKDVVACLAHNIRKTDVLARMGGDEFTVMFPATDQKSVKVVMQKVTEELNQLSKCNNWPTTFSIGVMTCTNGGCALDEIIASADKLMYEVKNTGKNNISYAQYPADHYS